MCYHIETRRLTLRAYEDQDARPLVDILGRFEVSKWLETVPHPFGVADLRMYQPDGGSRWPDTMAIERDGRLIGAVSSGAEVGYFLHPNHWGQGLASEALAAALRFRFETTEVDSLYAGVFAGNPASERVLAKAGFRKSGQSIGFCRARGCELACTDYTLTRSRWEELA